jgi:hypothetical protein
MTKTQIKLSIIGIIAVLALSCNRDNTAPEISLIGESSHYLSLGEKYVEQGATAYDENDGDLSSKIEISGSVNENLIDEYPIYYTVKDKAKNTASISRKVYVTAKKLESHYNVSRDDETFVTEVIATSSYNRLAYKNFGNFGNSEIFYSKTNGNDFIFDFKQLVMNNLRYSISEGKGYYSETDDDFRIDSVTYKLDIMPASGGGVTTKMITEYWEKLP